MKTLLILIAFAGPVFAATTADTTTSTAPANVEIIQTYTTGDPGEMGMVTAITPMPDHDDTSRIILSEDGIDPDATSTDTSSVDTGGN